MSEEQLKAFIAKVNDDQSIQEKLKAAKTPEDVVCIAKEHGHEFTADTPNKEGLATELSDDELESLSGGINSPLQCCCTAGTFIDGYSGI